MKISKRQLRRIIKEEKGNLLKENRLVGSLGFGANSRRMEQLSEQPISGEQADQMQHDQSSLFDYNYIYDLFYDDFADIEASSAGVSEESFSKFAQAVDDAMDRLKAAFVG